MSYRAFASPAAAALVASIAPTASLPVGFVVAAEAGQAPASETKPGKAWTPPRAPDGQPDLQGTWTSDADAAGASAEFAGKAVLSEAEAIGMRKAPGRTEQSGPARRVSRSGSRPCLQRFLVRARDQSRLRSTDIFDRRSSDGRIPPDSRSARKRQPVPKPGDCIPLMVEDLGLPVRCLLWPTAGLPMLPGGYNNNYRIVQAPGYVMILVEMIHDAKSFRWMAGLNC